MCKKEFSSKKGTLQERTKISVQQQLLLLKCQRWNVCDEGAADIAEVTPKTVRKFSAKAAERAEVHHNNNVKDVSENGVQLDELHAKLAGSVQWLGAAIGMQSLMILAIHVGNRNQELADNLLAAVCVCCRKITLVLTDGWACYYGAILRAFGQLYQPRRQKGRGRKKGKRLRFRGDFFYAQVVKGATLVKKRWRLSSVVLKGCSGKLDQCIRYIKAYNLGTTVHTAHIERWFGSLRSSLGCLRRKSRCPVKDSKRLKNKVWIFVSLYNWVLPHASLKLGGIARTPAMVAGLATNPLSYLEYILLPVHQDDSQQSKIHNKLERMKSKELVSAAKRTERPPPDERVVWKKSELNREAT